MIFVSGPRQVGKTTLFKQLMATYPGPLMNWDDLDSRKLIAHHPYQPFENHTAVYFDEIHKYPRWKNYLKGAFDLYGDRCLIHVTGSVKLDVYRRGGDSLLGRYLLFLLHPFSLAEKCGWKVPAALPDPLRVLKKSLPVKEHSETWSHLEKFGGFPEPFLAGSEKRHRNWLRTRHERLVREDIRDMSRIRELALMEQMIALLPERSGQLLSLNSLREILEVSHEAVRHWIDLLEQFYYLFLIPPYAGRLGRALKKERKLYLWDWSEVTEPGPRFENMVASHLLKWCDLMTQMGLGNLKLNYVRDKEKNEVDFVLLKENKPWLLVEAKLSDTNFSPSLFRFSERLGGISGIQLIRQSGVLSEKRSGQASFFMASADRFFSGLI
ncbi:MAG: AAA family ATPase [Bdellovibrionota bacterium]